MNQVIISTDAKEAKVQYYINQQLNVLYLKSYRVKTHTNNEMIFITYLFPEEVSGGDYIIPIAMGIMGFIQDDFAKAYARQIIYKYYNLMPSESNEMVQLLRTVEDKKQIEKMIQDICQELRLKNSFCVNGWITFRLERYKDDIAKNIDRLVFEYLAYKEYEIFIELLRQFVEVQPSLMKSLHIIPEKQGRIGLYNEVYEAIPSKDDEMTGGEDMVLNTILTISPLKIRIHQKELYKNKRLIQTIQLIYEDKISWCKNCEHCKQFCDILTPKKQ